MAIDSHMHINSLFLDNKDEYIRNINSSISEVINIGLDLYTSKEVVKISDKYDKFYSAVGIHPLYIEGQNIEKLYDISDNDKVIAIGEIGLDSLGDNYEEQKEYLIKQIKIANELCLPVIIHSNNTNSEIVKIFERVIKPEYGCVFHCFQPDFKTLDYLIKNNYYISFAGRITYKNAKKSLEVARIVPNELFLVETDSPYISPEPFRGEVNESGNIKYVIEKLAEIKNISYNEIDRISTVNTKRLFKKIEM